MPTATRADRFPESLLQAVEQGLAGSRVRTLTLDGRFTITSGSEVISEHAVGAPAKKMGTLLRCKKHVLSFDYPVVKYKMEGYKHKRGEASATAESGSFTESFK